SDSEAPDGPRKPRKFDCLRGRHLLRHLLPVLDCRNFMRPALSRAVLLSLLLLSSSWVYGYSLKKIAVTGSARIPEAEIVKATGLTAGANVTAEDLKDAANHLTESGVCSQVRYKFDGETAEYM